MTRPYCARATNIRRRSGPLKQAAREIAEAGEKNPAMDWRDCLAIVATMARKLDYEAEAAMDKKFGKWTSLGDAAKAVVEKARRRP